MYRGHYHYLKPNAISETIHNAIFVDCETDDYVRDDGITEKRLRFGWACFVKRNGRGAWCKPVWKRFTHPEEFWLWATCCCHRKRKTWMWCHNSKFDYPCLRVFTYLKECGWKCLSMCVEAPPTIIKFKLQQRTLVLCDTMNIWRMSLKKMGEMIGLEKLTMPREWHDDASDDAYCQRDVMIMVKAIQDWCDFLQNEDMGGFVPTIAAQAMRTFRHKYMDHKILIDDHEDALKLCRNAYKGGRVEAGFIGRLAQPVYHLDVNSMYPYVMAVNDFPTRLIAYNHFVSVRGLQALLRDYCVVAMVTLNTDEPFAPLLHEHKLIFPVGKFDTYLSSPELSYALDRGYIRHVYVAAIYERGPIFKRFCTDLYQKKQEASLENRAIDREHWKLILNSFSGKWGQNGRHYELSDDWPGIGKHITIVYNVKTGEKTYIRRFGEYVLTRTDKGESRLSHPAIAAHITGHARMVVWALIREMSAENHLYCDTDGFLTTQAGFDRLHHRIDDTALGKLKHLATYHDVWINGAKDYVLDGKRVLKGIRDDANETDVGIFEQVKWYGLAGLARAGSLDMPLTSVISKTLRRTYTKGVVGPTGFVTPLHFPLTTS